MQQRNLCSIPMAILLCAVALLWSYSNTVGAYMLGHTFRPVAKLCIKPSRSLAQHPSVMGNKMAPSIGNHKLTYLCSKSDEEFPLDVYDPNEVDEDFEDGSLVMTKRFKHSFYKNVCKGVLPLTTSLGFAAVPSTNMALRFAGAAAGGAVGLLARAGLRTKLQNEEKEPETAEELEPNTFHRDLYEDVQEDEADTKLQFLEKLSEGIIPIAMYIGFAAVPTSNLALRCVGAATGWVGGIVANDVLSHLITTRNQERHTQRTRLHGEIPIEIQNALAELRQVTSPWEELSCADLCAMARRHSVRRHHVDLFLALAVETIVLDVVSKLEPDLYKNLIGFVRFAYLKDMPFPAIANGLALAGIKIADQLPPCTDGTALYGPNFAPETLIQASKILFLSEKIYQKKHGFYEKKLVPALAYFPPQMYKQYLTEHSTMLYEALLKGAFVAQEGYTDRTVPTYKAFLTVSPEVSALQPPQMEDMVVQALRVALDENLPAASAPLEATFRDFANLQRGQELIGVNADTFTMMLLARTEPLFEDAVRLLLEQVVDHPEQASTLAQKLVERRDALHIPPRSAAETLRILVRGHNEAFSRRIEKIHNLKDSTPEDVNKAVAAYAHTFEAFVTFGAPVMEHSPYPLSVPVLPFDEFARAGLLQAQKDAAARQPATLTVSHITEQMFNVGDDLKAIVTDSLTIVKVQSWIAELVRKGSFNEHAKSAYLGKLKACGVNESDWTATALDMYHSEMSKLVRTSAAVPSQEAMDKLIQLRDFLNLGESAAQKVHLDLLGDKYVKAVTESMSLEGGMAEEYSEGLKRLRQRLGLSYPDALILFSIAANKQVAPVVKTLVDLWKTETDVAYRREKERKEKKNPENGAKKVFMREALNLVDGLDDMYRLMESESEGGVPSHLRIHALGLASPEDIEGMYKHFLINRLSEPDSTQRLRYIARSPALARFFQISDEEQREAADELAFTAYHGLLMQVLRTHDAIEREHIAQFQLLVDAFKLTSETAAIIYEEATKKAILDTASNIMETKKDGSTVTPQAVRRLRKQVMIFDFKYKCSQLLFICFDNFIHYSAD